MSRRSPADGTTGSGDVSVSRSILVLFGSETGNSQEFAEDLDRCAQRLHFQSRVCEMDSVQLVSLASLVLFVKSRSFSLMFPCLPARSSLVQPRQNFSRKTISPFCVKCLSTG